MRRCKQKDHVIEPDEQVADDLVMGQVAQDQYFSSASVEPPSTNATKKSDDVEENHFTIGIENKRTREHQQKDIHDVWDNENQLQNKVSCRSVLGNFHQASPSVFSHAAVGSQCSTICLMSIIGSFSKPPLEWTSEDIDTVVTAGDQRHLDVLKVKGWPNQRQETKVDIDELPTEVKFSFGDKVMHASVGILNNIKCGKISEIDDLARSVIIGSVKKNIILRIQDKCRSIIANSANDISLFDPHACSEDGGVDADGAACIIHFDDIYSLIVHLKSLAKGNQNDQVDFAQCDVELLTEKAIDGDNAGDIKNKRNYPIGTEMQKRKSKTRAENEVAEQEQQARTKRRCIQKDHVFESDEQVADDLVMGQVAQDQYFPSASVESPSTNATKKSDTAMIHNHRNLSKKLYDILEHVGGSEAMRKLYQTTATTWEITDMMRSHLSQLFGVMFIFGSFWEGATTPGLHSDIDCVFCNDVCPVIENIDDAAGLADSFLMVRDDHTQHGYVKLQMVVCGIPFKIDKYNYIPGFDLDCNGRICENHVSRIGNMECERNGPAYTDIRQRVDRVPAYRCASVPECASEWISRPRLYGWPSGHMIGQMKTSGCFVVGIGHPASAEKHIEWRLSFSLQERQLMSSFNTVQHKCYIILKMIKKNLIEPELKKSICSYHCKTCMFHVIENTAVSIWRRENLFSCVRLCLIVLLKFVENGFCPNYFIKEENMFDRDVHRTVKPRLIDLLRALINAGHMLLLGIECDQIGDILMDVANIDSINKTSMKYSKYLKVFTINHHMLLRTTVNRAMKGNDLVTNYRYYSELVQSVASGAYFRDHNEQQTREVFPQIISFLHSRLAQQLISLALRSTYNPLIRDLVLRSCHHSQQGSGCDMTSSRLWLASVLYKFGLYDRCERLLEQITTDLQTDVLSVCTCNYRNCDIRLRGIPAEYSPSSLSSTATCVLFLPSESTLAPPPLQYEMYRSAVTPPGSRDEKDDYWYDCAVLDGMVYIHFLQCLVYSKMNKIMHKRVAIGNMRWVLQNEAYLGHRETGYNLLGWLYAQDNRFPEAVQCFLKSWRIKPLHNAAKWHLGILLYDLYRNQT